MATLTRQIGDNLKKLNGSVAAILARSKLTNRCQLIAVSKTKPVSAIISAYDAGQRVFGENYV